MMKKDEKQYVSVTDIALCSLLVGAGHKVQFIEKHGRQGEFFFERNKDLEALQQAFWARQPLNVIPATLFEVAKHLKAMVEAQPYETTERSNP